jgi:adenylate cyclase class 2
MAIEIELKARVKDIESLKTALAEKSESSFRFEKEDVYWSRKAGRVPKIRVRREKRFFANGKYAAGIFAAGVPEGNSESLCLVTYKKKEVKDGIEINDEREFEIRPSTGRAIDATGDFEDLLKVLGFKISASKKKRGWAYTITEKNARLGLDNICAELVEVEGLGWFVELEIVANANADNNREEMVEEGKKRLLDLLDSLGIKREAVESRYYTEMLTQRICPKRPHAENAG